jgi:small-conductance mechanosensitive channel
VFFIAIIALVQLVLVSSNAEAQLDTIAVIDIDDYSKEISSGESATYNWTLYNIDENNVTYDVSISISSDTDWDVTLNPDTTITLMQWEARTVTLTVSAPTERKEESTTVTLTFITERNGAVIHYEKRNATTFLPKIIEPEKELVIGLFENPLPAPLDNEFGIFLLTVLFWLIGSLILVFLLDPVVKAFTLKTKTEVDDIVLRIIRTPLLFLVFFYGFVSSLRILDEHIPSVVLDIVNALYGIAAVLILFYVAYKLFKDILVYYGELVAERTKSNIDDVIIPIVEKIGVVIIGLLALGYLLGYMNIDLTVFVAGGVVISMVIAFAAQETLSNFFSGIFILTDRPFQEGDTLILPDGDWYEVRDIGLRSTRLFRFKDASLISIPNNKLAGDKIVNYSNPSDKVRIRMKIGVAYGTDAAKVKKILDEIFAQNEHIIKDDEALKPVIRFDELGESSINFFIQVIVDDRDNKLGVIDYLNTEIYDRFNKEGIEIPFPQRVIHMKSEKGG